MRSIGIDHLSLYDLKPHELVRVAAATGFQSVGLFIEPIPFTGFAAFNLSPGSTDFRELRSALAATGLVISTLDPFLMLPEINFDNIRRNLDIGASLGARAINVVILDPDQSRQVDRLGQLFVLATERKLDLVIEAYTLSEIRTAADALTLADAVSSEIGLTIDALHVRRAGGCWTDVVCLPQERIRYVQFSDGPSNPPDDLGYEATFERAPPGHGELDLLSLFPLLPRTALISVEAPATKLKSDGVSPLARAERLSKAMRRMLA
jgi:sugar phosphate isomerase/epimerase